MKDLVYFLVFDGFVDWEAALALCEINKSERYRVVTVGFTAEPATSMGGLRIYLKAGLDGVEPDRAALFILPGGTMWEVGGRGSGRHAVPAEHGGRAHRGALRGHARSGARRPARRRRHTSNAPGYLGAYVPAYIGTAHYVAEALAVTDGKVITASGAGSVEFAREVIQLLGLYSEAALQE